MSALFCKESLAMCGYWAFELWLVQLRSWFLSLINENFHWNNYASGCYNMGWCSFRRSDQEASGKSGLIPNNLSSSVRTTYCFSLLFETWWNRVGHPMFTSWCRTRILHSCRISLDSEGVKEIPVLIEAIKFRRTTKCKSPFKVETMS